MLIILVGGPTSLLAGLATFQLVESSYSFIDKYGSFPLAAILNASLVLLIGLGVFTFAKNHEQKKVARETISEARTLAIQVPADLVPKNWFVNKLTRHSVMLAAALPVFILTIFIYITVVVNFSIGRSEETFNLLEQADTAKLSAEASATFACFLVFNLVLAGKLLRWWQANSARQKTLVLNLQELISHARLFAAESIHTGKSALANDTESILTEDFAPAIIPVIGTTNRCQCYSSPNQISDSQSD